MAPNDDFQVIHLRSAAWYGDQLVSLSLPKAWSVDVRWPSTPPALSDDQIREVLHRPAGQAPLREMVRGHSHPVILVDDISRPTPASRVVPFVLGELDAAGIAPESVTVVMATGTHGPPAPGGLEKKVGEMAAARCRLVVHDHRRDVTRLGRTRFGTPVLVNRHVAASDYVIGIGGVYPQHDTWFGGGSKLILGVLGERSIANLHYRHSKFDGHYAIDNDFRRDLDEVGRLVGLRTSITLHIDAHRTPVRIGGGDPWSFYAEEAKFSRDAYRAPTPDGADVVIANAYPMDTSLTFAASKGTIPLRHAAPGASRVLLASCPEGAGEHFLFPLVHVPRYYYGIQHLRRQLINRSELPAKIRWRMKQLAKRESAPAPAARPGAPPAAREIHLFRPVSGGAGLDESISGLNERAGWEDVLARIDEEQNGRRALRAVVYACAPLQTLAFADELSELVPRREEIFDE